MMHVYNPEPAALHEQLAALIEETVPKNLAAAHSLVHYFATTSDQVPQLLKGPQVDLRPAVRTKLVHSFKTAFLPDRIDALAAAVRSASPYVLLHVCWGLDRIRAGGMNSGVPFEGWEQVARLLLMAAEKHPADVVPQVIPFVADEETRLRLGSDNDELVGRFNRERAQRLFDFDALMAVLVRSELRSFHDPRFKARYETVRAAALAHIAVPTPAV
jgi:hypothetical protein